MINIIKANMNKPIKTNVVVTIPFDPMTILKIKEKSFFFLNDGIYMRNGICQFIYTGYFFSKSG